MWRDVKLGLHAEGEAADAWTRVLRQDRLAWALCDGPDQAIVIVDGALPEWLDDRVARGGVAVITGAPRADVLLGPSRLATLYRFRPPDRDRDATMPCLARVFEGDGDGEIRLHENRKPRDGQLSDVRAAVLTRRHGAGWVVFTGLPLATHLAAVGDALRAFTEASAVTERVASVDKADIADTMTWMLAHAVTLLGLPLVRIARYPRAARSVFLFRVDVDGLFGDQCRAIAEVATRHGIRGSFYFNASLCRAHPGSLSRDWLTHHEITHHADIHDLFDTVEQNRTNLLGGMAWVEANFGLRATGYVAPRGLWNAALDLAMADLGHLYSSDFGLDFDSLPFFTPAGILQIPVHPFSPERFVIHQEDAGLGAPGHHAVLHHYLTALDRQVALRRPAQLYGHPEVLGRMAPAVLPPLFEAVERHALPTMTMADFADWWIARDRTELALAVDESTGAVAVETDGHALEVFATKPGHLTLDGTAHVLAPDRWTILPRNDEAAS